MTKLLLEAVARVSALPEEEQNRAAQAMIAFASEQRTYVLNEQQIAGIYHAIDQADRGEFASDDEVKEIFGNDL